MNLQSPPSQQRNAIRALFLGGLFVVLVVVVLMGGGHGAKKSQKSVSTSDDVIDTDSADSLPEPTTSSLEHHHHNAAVAKHDEHHHVTPSWYKPGPGITYIEFTLGGLNSGVEENVVLELHSDWAPLGVERLLELHRENFFRGVRFFRCVTSFVVQFGISGDPATAARWRRRALKDDPVKTTNAYGTVAYAMAGKSSRTSQLFFNTKKEGNGFLDGMGFAPIGRVVHGMDVVVNQINHKEGEKPAQGRIQAEGNAYLNSEFSDLSYIVDSKIYTGGQ